jgi:hypothetical protein
MQHHFHSDNHGMFLLKAVLCKGNPESEFIIRSNVIGFRVRKGDSPEVILIPYSCSRAVYNSRSILTLKGGRKIRVL